MTGDSIRERDGRARYTGPASVASPVALEASPQPPRLVQAVQFAGPVVDGGFEQTQWLISRDGQFLQVSELLYRVAEHVDGKRTPQQIADAVTDVMPYRVTAAHIDRLLETKLAPLGLLTSHDDVAPDARSTTGPLRVAGRIAAVGPRVLDPVTAVLRVLFHPLLAVPLLVAIAVAHVWLYLGHGIGGALVELIQRPLLVVPLFGIIVAAGVFHEFGHAAALRYGGGRSRSMGFGFYLIYPALYTDTSDAYRLGRGARIRTDLGGFYFHQVFALVLVALSVTTGHSIWLLAVLVIDLEMLRQLLFPFVRFDGYWLLADLTGIPDLYTHLGAVARRRLGGNGDPGAPPLRPWPRRVFTVYAAIAVPTLVGLLVLFAVRAPAFLRVLWDSWHAQGELVAAAVRGGDIAAAAVPALQIALLTLPLVGAAYLVVNLALMAMRVRRTMRSAQQVAPSAL